MFYSPDTDTWACHAENISKLMAKAVRGHLDCEHPNAVLNIETHLFNVTLTADSYHNDIDVGKELWLTKGRWSRLMKEYVPIEPLNRFIDQAVEIMQCEARLGATANMMFRDPERYTKKHRWGGCLMGATFRGDNGKAGPATLTLYSRTTYMGYMALLDAAIASCIAREIEKRRDANYQVQTRKLPPGIAFRWYISSQQLHCFKTLPYIYSQPDLFARVVQYAKQKRAQNVLSPTWKHTAKWYAKVLEHWRVAGQDVDTMLANEKYGPFKRIKRRWLEHQGHLNKRVPPSLKLDELDFSKCV